jgi:hypothetical protein
MDNGQKHNTCINADAEEIDVHDVRWMKLFGTASLGFIDVEPSNCTTVGELMIGLLITSY